MDGGDAAATGSERLSVTVRECAGSVVLRPDGELDHDTADLLRQHLDRALDEESRTDLVVDCAGLEFCDSTGLNVLLGARLRTDSRGGAVHLVAMKPQVARVFEVTGAEAVFRMHDTVQDALGSTPST